MSEVSLTGLDDNPEFGMGRRVMSFPARTGAVSPLDERSVSPIRSGAVSPIQRDHSPATRAVSPLVTNAVGTRRVGRRSTLDMKRARQTQSLTLDTQMLAEQRPDTASTEEEEALDEVIMLSPAVRAPIKSFVRRSTIGSRMMSPAPGSIRNGSSMTIDSIAENGDKPYFGQNVNEEDLVAVNLDNAFEHFDKL